MTDFETVGQQQRRARIARKTIGLKVIEQDPKLAERLLRARLVSNRTKQDRSVRRHSAVAMC